MKKLISLIVVALMLVSVVACSGSTTDTTAATTETTTEATTETTTEATTAAGGTFKLGFSGPLTGGAAIYGNAAMVGAQIAVDEINAMGGAIQFEFNAQDDAHDAEQAVNAYNTLLDWEMQAMVGTVTTAPCIAVSAQAYQDRLFMMTPSASSADVTADKDNMFQVCFTDPAQGTLSAQYIAENFAGATVAVFYKNDDAYSQGIRDTFVAEAATQGLNVVYEGTFTDSTATDFSVQLIAAQAAGADLIFLPMYYTPASVIMKQASDMGYAPTFFGVDGMDGILTLEGFDTSLAEGVYLLTPFAADATDDATVSFVTEYQNREGETPNQFAADGYDAVYAIYYALEAAGCTADMSHEEICEALIASVQTITVNGLTGTMTWDASGAVTKTPKAVVIENGVYVTPNK